MIPKNPTKVPLKTSTNQEKTHGKKFHVDSWHCFFSNPSDPNFAVGVGEARKKHVPYFPWNPACLIWILIMLDYSH